VEQDGVGTVLPRSLEAQPHAPVGVLLEPLLRQRRSSDVANEALETLAITTIDRYCRMNVDAAAFGERVLR
jgi:hypothetical protein